MPPPHRTGKGLGEEDESDFGSELNWNLSATLGSKLLTRELMGSPSSGGPGGNIHVGNIGGASQPFNVSSLYSQSSSTIGSVGGLGLQPPRSLTSQSMSRGYVSPTGFPPTSLPRSLPQQQHSPNRGLLPFDNRSGLLNQRSTSDTKRIGSGLG